jgi:cell fate regulator YaaT (PSP1 superfamily)
VTRVRSAGTVSPGPCPRARCRHATLYRHRAVEARRSKPAQTSPIPPRAIERAGGSARNAQRPVRGMHPGANIS